MELQFNIGVSDCIQEPTDYSEQLITMNPFVKYAKEGRCFKQFENPNGRYNLIVFDFKIEYQTRRSLQDIMSWFYIQPTMVLYNEHARAFLIYYIEEGFTQEEFLKIYTLLLYVVYSHEDLGLLLEQNDLSYLLNPIQFIDNSLPVVKTEVFHGNTITIEKINQLYKLNPGCNTYEELYNRIVLPYFKRKFDSIFNFSATQPSPINNTDNDFYNEFKTYYFQCNEQDRSIRKLATQFNLTRYRSEQLIKRCLTLNNE